MGKNSMEKGLYAAPQGLDEEGVGMEMDMPL